MSRHPFYKIIKNHSKLEHSNNHDVKGNPLLQWFQDGFVGWDEICLTMDTEFSEWRTANGSAPKTYALMKECTAQAKTLT